MHIRGQRATLTRILNSRSVSSRRSSLLSSRLTAKSTSGKRSTNSNSSLNKTQLSGTSKLVSRYMEMEDAATKMQKGLKNLASKTDKYTSLTDDKNRLESTLAQNQKKLTEADESDGEKIKKDNSLIEADIKTNKTALEEVEKDTLKYVEELVTSYNKMYDKIEEMSGTTGYTYIKNLTNILAKNKTALGEIGISVSKGKLSIDENSLKKADMNKIKSLFNSKESFVSELNEVAVRVESTANVMLRTVDKTSGTSTYNKYGQNNTYSTGRYTGNYNSYI